MTNDEREVILKFADYSIEIPNEAIRRNCSAALACCSVSFYVPLHVAEVHTEFTNHNSVYKRRHHPDRSPSWFDVVLCSTFHVGRR